MSVTTTRDTAASILKGLREVSDMEVLIGIPAEKSGRKDPDGPTNAEIGFLNEFGSPAKRIPARPHLRPGVKAAEKELERPLGDALKACIGMQPDRAAASLSQAGALAARHVKRIITDGIPPPLSRMAIENRIAMSKTGRKGAREALRLHDAGLPTGDLVKPLIVTGQYLRSITYVVAKRGTRKTAG